ncbi:nucleosome assembly protein 1-like isoform X1 [Nasonia vitripennis]|uniref:Nucleosome assembly protein 1-like 4 n=1 Tax=Nasonia vitripennis TaxID=7425 RepID=A0A7M7R307_NASVI|nr:nucleosome assembly protein 1-like isoform X1 [Nasonia vitripennis]XP_031781462.1 nucleosome assembly protein 1-like isoform X1 [Nasonia vitripennis]XP_032457580.1 nucleosome assembly protein 1-like isoform X1 [Nasonia vitripennis]
MAVDPERASASDLDSMEDEDETTKPTKKYTQENLLAALQDRLNEFNIEHLPAPVKRRIKALKQLQLKTTHIEAKFYEEVHALECRYYQLCAPYYEQRSNVVSGIYEPKDEECLWESEDEEEISTDLKSKVKIIEVKDEAQIKKDNSADDENVKGIPDFWLTIFKNVGMLAEMLQEHDEPILKHLYDIKVLFLEKDPMGFVLEFHFSPNDYFSNSVLTKEYHMKCVPEKDDPFSFEGPEIYKCKGCIIDWKKGKNVTVKTIKKSQKHKSRGSKRTVTKTVQNDSFFNFFTPPIVPDDADAEVDDETQVLLTSDFEIGHYIRERIVPRAILYFTGEGLEDEDEDYEEDDGDDDDGDDDDDDDEDEEDGSHSGGKLQEDGSQPAECKQQ